MQRAVNVELSPEEDMTVSVSPNDFGNGIDRGSGVVGMAGLTVCNGNKGIPLIAVQEP